MKRKMFFLLSVTAAIMASAQWSEVTPSKDVIRRSDNSLYYKLDIGKIRTQLLTAPKYGEGKGVTIKIPTLNRKIEKFIVNSLPVVDEALANEYQLGSYVGVGIEDPSKYIRFSVAPNDFQSMMISDGKYEFIEPAIQDKSAYSIHGITKNGRAFTCSTKESKESISKMQQMMSSAAAAKFSDKKYRTLRLAMSVTGEYTSYFGGTANALAQINATLTRINGIFEQEFSLHLTMVNAPNLIFTDAASDPYSDVSQKCKWNYELMNVLHNGAYGVTDDSFDIGHLLASTGDGGSSVCIGCIGSNDVSTTNMPVSIWCGDYLYISPNNYKGAAMTSPIEGDVPMGNKFDFIVAHEMGHQLGANHTFSRHEGTGTEVEPGSGSTIMSYAGITEPDDNLQDHHDPYFHSVSIDEVQAHLTTVTVDVEIPANNNTPIVGAMPITYTIPRSTAFVLTASATDPDGDALTYCWEQVDACILNDGIDKTNIGNETSGATFRSWPAVSTPTRYFPKLATVLGGSVVNVNDFESASNVARTTHFRVTARDNRPAGQAQTAYATQTIVVGSANPFTVNTTSLAPNTNSTVAWTVSGTTAAPYNVANVKIDYTFDAGVTWTVLAASVPNTGSASVFIPAALAGKNGHLRVSAIGNVFYSAKQASVSSLATSEAGSVKTIKIYPNPVEDILNVVNVSSKSPYEIYNAVGQLISKGTLGDGKIVVRNLVKGVYFININDKGTGIKTKFVKK